MPPSFHRFDSDAVWPLGEVKPQATSPAPVMISAQSLFMGSGKTISLAGPSIPPLEPRP